jgi:ssDNA-binding replication factor A large subunit
VSDTSLDQWTTSATAKLDEAITTEMTKINVADEKGLQSRDRLITEEITVESGLEYEAAIEAYSKAFPPSHMLSNLTNAPFK